METGERLSLHLRDMTGGDIEAGHALSRRMKWPHRIEDWEALLRIGSGVVAELGGEIVGTTMGWPYGPEAACLGMVIVSPEHQGQGIGRKVMDAMIERLGDRAIMLNATEEGLALYRKLGFEEVGTIHQHQGAAFSVPVAALAPNVRIRPMGVNDRQRIADLDRRATGMTRDALFAELRRERAQGVMLDRDGEAIGFALFRRFGRGYAVGPTVAPDRRGAKALISHWLGSHPGIFCRVDVPGDAGLCDWLDEIGLPSAGKVRTMVRGKPPARDAAVKIWSIASQALG